MAITLDYIKSCIEDFAKKIDVPNNLLPTYGKSEYGPTSYITIDDKFNLTYIIPGDRGDDRYIEAVDLDHLLYIVFQGITLIMSMSLASKTLNPNIDKRRQQFKIQLELLERLNLQWKQREEHNQQNKEICFPFNDYEGQRQFYIRELLGNGFLHDEAIKKAYEKYP